jgi:hypothetical protein
MGKKRKKSERTPEELAKSAEVQRRLQERIDYHERKLKEERAARGEQPASS